MIVEASVWHSLLGVQCGGLPCFLQGRSDCIVEDNVFQRVLGLEDIMLAQ